MKNKKSILSSLVLFICMAQSAQAKFLEIANNPVTALIGGMNSSLSIPTKSGSDVTFTFGFEGNFAVDSGIQISIPVMLLTASSTVFQMNAGPQFNFGDTELLNQFFATVRPGFMTGGGDTYFVLNGGFGKRFKVTESVSFRPSIGVNVLFVSNNNSADIYLSPASFSIEI